MKEAVTKEKGRWGVDSESKKEREMHKCGREGGVWLKNMSEKLIRQWTQG